MMATSDQRIHDSSIQKGRSEPNQIGGGVNMNNDPFSPFQQISSSLFGKTADDLRRQLDGPIKLPRGISDIDLIKLENIAREAWTSGKGNDLKKQVVWQGQILPQQKARWLIVQEARIALRQGKR
jgi:hypothetical protein